MLEYRFEDSVDSFTGEKYRDVIIFDSIFGLEKDRVRIHNPSDKHDHAYALARCAYLDKRPCECGAAKTGIKPFAVGHSDWCCLYRNPLVNWG